MQTDINSAYESYNFHSIYQKIHNFCAGDLGGVYLDIIKDRQYTCQSESLARRSAQTALYHVAEAVVRWIAPILCFTAEEAWQALPGERSDSVHLAEWYQLPVLMADKVLSDDDWQQLIAVKEAVNKALEVERQAGRLKGSLEASVTLYCDEALASTLEKVGDELRFILITSSARVLSPSELPACGVSESTIAGLRIQVELSQGKKCVRCWHHREDVGSNTKHPDICARCVDNVEGEGEQRSFA